MPQRKPFPHLAQFVQWRQEGQLEAEKELKDIDPFNRRQLEVMFIKGYIRGRVMQWRLEQEIQIQVEKLRSDLDNETQTR